MLRLCFSNHTHSGDGHDKLMGFMNSTFPLAVYELQDVFSGYILYLKLWTSNSDLKLVGRWYLEHLYKTKGNGTLAILINTQYIAALQLCKLHHSFVKGKNSNIHVKMLTKTPNICLTLFLKTVISNHLRLDRGSETGHMETIHSSLIQDAANDISISGEDTVHYGTSTNNKVFSTNFCFLVKYKIINTN